MYVYLSASGHPTDTSIRVGFESHNYIGEDSNRRDCAPSPDTPLNLRHLTLHSFGTPATWNIFGSVAHGVGTNE